MIDTITADKVARCKEIINGLRLKNGMYFASPHSTYNFLWTRDNCFIALTYLNDPSDIFERTIWSLLDYYLAYEWKIDIHNHIKPQHTYERIHIRFSQDLKEIPVEWNHRQNDCIGIFLYCIGEGIKKGKKMLRNEHDKRIVQKIVNYAELLEVYSDEDGGYWEEINEKRSSSIASCYRGLLSVRDIVNVPEHLIKKCKEALYELFPYETPTRKYDLAQLSLNYYEVFDKEMSEIIVRNIEDNLLRERGVVRYIGDSYYSTLEKEHGRGRSRDFYINSEAEWCFGYSYLSLAWLKLGNLEKAKYYIDRTEEVMLPDGSIPELYYAKTNKYNVNTPLCWSQAMYVQSVEEYRKYT